MSLEDMLHIFHKKSQNLHNPVDSVGIPFSITANHSVVFLLVIPEDHLTLLFVLQPLRNLKVERKYSLIKNKYGYAEACGATNIFRVKKMFGKNYLLAQNWFLCDRKI